MKIILLIMLFVSFPALSEVFDSSKNKTDSVSVKWTYVKDVQTACNRESKKNGLGGFKFAVEACSFWSKSMFGMTCHIITEVRTSHDTIGHELRHCFQGAFHK